MKFKRDINVFRIEPKASVWCLNVPGLDLPVRPKHSYVEIGHEIMIISMAVLPGFYPYCLFKWDSCQLQGK